MEPPGTAPGSEPIITGAFIAIVGVAPDTANIGGQGGVCKVEGRVRTVEGAGRVIRLAGGGAAGCGSGPVNVCHEEGQWLGRIGQDGASLTNHLPCCDNLTVLPHRIASESVDHVSLDPPFYSNAS